MAPFAYRFGPTNKTPEDQPTRTAQYTFIDIRERYILCYDIDKNATKLRICFG